MSAVRHALANPAVQRAISVARRVWFAGRDEVIVLAGHKLRFTPGTRPTRLKYRDDPDQIVRNDVRQLEFFCANVRAGESVIDVGANYGQYAVLFGALTGPDGRVVAFEPDARSREILERNIAINGFKARITVEPFAVFDSGETREFFTRPGDNMSSLQRAGFGTNAEAEDITHSPVQTVSIDDYLASNGLHDPRWLKVDAEGAEINVLRGASRLLHANTRIVCELHPYAWSSFGTTFDELVELVRGAGRQIRYLDSSLGPISAGPRYGAVVID